MTETGPAYWKTNERNEKQRFHVFFGLRVSQVLYMMVPRTFITVTKMLMSFPCILIGSSTTYFTPVQEYLGVPDFDSCLLLLYTIILKGEQLFRNLLVQRCLVAFGRLGTTKLWSIQYRVQYLIRLLVQEYHNCYCTCTTRC